MTPMEAAASDSGGDGPWRRVWSVPGFSWMAAEVYLPSRAHGEIAYGPGGDTASIASGGWGANGEVVDSGLLHDPARDEWSLFLWYANDDQQFTGGAPRLAAGQWVTLTYGVPADGILRLTVAGSVTGGGRQTVSLDYPSPENVTGWTAAGHGQVLTRTTTIRQNPETFSNGSFLRNVQWRNVQVGTSPDTTTSWGATQNGGDLMYPTHAQNPGVVLVNYVDAGNETVTIRCQAS